MALSTSYFKNMVPLRSLSFKIMPGRSFLGLPTYMGEVLCTGTGCGYDYLYEIADSSYFWKLRSIYPFMAGISKGQTY